MHRERASGELLSARRTLGSCVCLPCPPPGWTPPELVRRIAVTLAVLALFRAGSHVPLPGLDVGLLFLNAGTRGSVVTLGLVSIMTLGITPLLSALILVEITKTFWPRFSAWAGAPRNGRRIEQAAVAAALALAALQATGLAIALEDVVGLVPEPGFAFRAGIVVALTAATAVAIWLAAVITQHGIGHGFWVLLVAPLLATASQSVVERASDYGTAGATSIAMSGVLLVASIAPLAALCKARPGLGGPADAAWCSILGLTLAGWLVTGVWVAIVLIAPEHAPPLEQVASHDGFLLLGLGGMALVAALRSRRQRASGTPPWPQPCRSSRS